MIARAALALLLALPVRAVVLAPTEAKPAMPAAGGFRVNPVSIHMETPGRGANMTAVSFAPAIRNAAAYSPAVFASQVALPLQTQAPALRLNTVASTPENPFDAPVTGAEAAPALADGAPVADESAAAVQTAPAEPVAPNAPAFKRRLAAILSRIVNPFGTRRDDLADPAPAGAASTLPKQVDWGFKLKTGAYYYHGTTWNDLQRIVDAGGEMAVDVSNFSLIGRDSVDYAYQRQYRVGAKDNPVVLLQFPAETLAPLVSHEPFRPAAAMIDRGVPPNHQSYALAVKPVPLALMTEASKSAILSFVITQAAQNPGDPRWVKMLPRLESVLQPRRLSSAVQKIPESHAEGVAVEDFAHESTLVARGGLLASMGRALRKIAFYIDPPAIKNLYDASSRAHFYHGLSLATLEAAIDGGGFLAAKKTYLSDEAGYPYGYAASSSRRTWTPGVVLQFEPSLMKHLIVPGHYNPRAPAPGEKWEDVPHWFMADQDIPLATLTEASKRSILNWLAAQRDAHPTDSIWTTRIAKFEKALGATAPAPKTSAVAEPETLARRLGLQGLTFKGERWSKDGLVLDRLGQGTIGMVDAHPTRPGLIVKTISPNFDQLLMGLTIDEAIRADEKAAEVLARAGVGPKVIGSTVIERRRVTVRERIIGETMRALSDKRAFGPAEEALVLEMVRKMAAAGALVTDIKPENIMIGVTEKDPTRRAWFVDGGMVEQFEAGMDEEARYERLLNYPNVIAVRPDFNARQMIESTRTLRQYLDEARDAATLSPWKLFFKRLGQAFLASGGAAGYK